MNKTKRKPSIQKISLSMTKMLYLVQELTHRSKNTNSETNNTDKEANGTVKLLKKSK